MKNLKSIIILIMLVSASSLWAKGEQDTLRFEVQGNCEMCKERIEASLDVRGVKSAVWDIETHMIVVVYDKTKISEDKIHESIAKAGYDTSKMKATEKAYDDLPGCCQYTREKKKK